MISENEQPQNIQIIKYDNLLILRGIACITVIFDHLTGPIISLLPKSEQSNWLQHFIPYGFQAVWLFFMLSSFLLTTAFLKQRFKLDEEGIRYFFLTRAKRLLPAFYVAQFLVILHMIMAVAPSAFTLSVLIREGSILIFAPWVPYFGATTAVGSWNSPIWSVLIEVQFIILLPLFIRWMIKKPSIFIYALGGWYLWLLCIFIWNDFHIHKIEIWPKLYDTHFYNAGFFLLGMLAAWSKFYCKFSNIPRPPLVIGATILIYMAVNYFAHDDLNSVLIIVGPFFLAPIFFLLLLSIDTDYQKRLPQSYRELIPVMSWKSVFERIGVMSYSVYLRLR